MNTMTKTLLALAALTVWTGAAEAKKADQPARQCSLGARALVLEQAPSVNGGRVERSDLVGKEVRAVRWASQRNGNVIEIAVGAEHFVIRSRIVPHSSPAVFGASTAGSNARGVRWSRKSNPAFPPEEVASVIDAGPLAGLSLRAGECA